MRLHFLYLALVFAAPLASAATFTWDGNGANNLLLEPVNWLGNNAPPDNGTADLVFTGSARTTPDLNRNFQIQSITFNSSASPFTINQIGGVGLKFEIGTGGISQDNGSTQTINTDITLAATQTWHANAGTLSIGSSGTSYGVNMNGNLVSLLTNTFHTINLNSRIYGSGNITKSGLGFLNLYNGSNSWSGTMTLSGGIVRLQGNNAFSASSALNINSTGRFDLNGYDTTALWLGGSGQIDLDGGELTVGDSSNRSYNGVIEGTGGKLIKQGSGSLTLTGTQITNDTEYWAKSGTLIVQDSLGTSPQLKIDSGATMEISTPSLGASNLSGFGTLDLNGNDLDLVVGTGLTSFFFGTLNGSANADLEKFGNGKLILADAETYTGEIRVSDGRLGFSGDGLFGYNSPLGAMIVNPSGRLELDGTQQSFRLISGSGVIDLDGGELRLLGFDHPTDTKFYNLNIEGNGDLIFAPDNTTTGWYNPDIDISSSSLNFNGKIIVEDGFVIGFGNFYVRDNELEIGSNAQVIVSSSGLGVKTITGAGTLVSRSANTVELIGDGGNYSYSGLWTFHHASALQTIEVHNQTWTFDGDIYNSPESPTTRVIVHGDAIVNLKTKSNGEISIPDQVEVQAGGHADFALNAFSRAWTLSGPSGLNPVSGTAGITAANGAVATVSLQPSFNNTLLTSTSSGGRIRLIQTDGRSNVRLSGTGIVELEGDLTLKSLTGTMDIDLRGHTLFIDLNSALTFGGRFIDSIGGGEVSLYGEGDLTLEGMSTFEGLLSIGADGTELTPGRLVANNDETLSDWSSVHLAHDDSELDLLDHTLTIKRLSGHGLLTGTTGSSLALLESNLFGATFGGAISLDLIKNSNDALAHSLEYVSATLDEFSADIYNLEIYRSNIEASSIIDLRWNSRGETNSMEIIESTISTLGSLTLGAPLNGSAWFAGDLRIQNSTLEGSFLAILGYGSIGAQIENSTLRGTSGGIGMTLDGRNLSISRSDLRSEGRLYLQTRNLTNLDSDSHSSLSNTTVETQSLYAGHATSMSDFYWSESSLIANESNVRGAWTIEASDLDFGTLTTEVDASSNFLSGAISVGNDLSVGNDQFLGNQLTLTGLHELNVGGTLSVERLAVLTLDRGDLMVSNMTVDGDFDWIAGDLTLSRGHSIGFSSFLGNDAVLSTGQTLHVDIGLTVDYGGSLTLDGGTVLIRGSGNSLTNNGTLSQSLGPIRTESFFNNFGATTFIGSLFTVENQVMQAVSATNSGTIEMTGAISILQLQNSGKLSNQGLIGGTGVIDGSIENTNSFSRGRIRADLGEAIRITGDLDNAGAIELVGGSVEVQGILTNTGDITGRGLLAGNRANPTAIDNQGSMTFSGGTSDVYGNVLNSSGGTIISTGSGVVTFHDNFINNGTEMRTSEGSSAVFLGDVSGSGAFNGTGTVYFEGSFSPGNSPGLVTATVDLVMGPSLVSIFEVGGNGQGTEYDFVDAEGDLALDGKFYVRLYDNFLPEAGNSFDLFDARTITGSFDEVVTEELPEGLEWDLSQLESDGIVSVQSTETDPYDSWASYWGLLGADAELSADPNGDGISNLEHFAFDTSPLGGGTEGRSRVEIADDGGQLYLTYTFPVRVGASFDATPSASIDGMIYSVRGDDDLQGQDLSVAERSALSAGMPTLRDIDGDSIPDWEYRSFRLTLQVSGQTRGFLQVSVESAP